MRKQRRLTLAEQAYEELQSRIMSGSLPAGQRLLPVELAEELEVSQTPVKEALAALERDGLVRAEARRASQVRHFTREDVAEIYEARILLELHAAETIARRGLITPAFLAELEGLLDRLAAHAGKSQHDLAIALQADCAFHEAIVRLAGNSLLAEWHRTVIRQFQTARNFSVATYPMRRTRASHGAVLDALRAGDPAGIVSALREHLESSRAEMLARPEADRPVRDDGLEPLG